MSGSYESDANDNGIEKWIDSDSSADSDSGRTRLGRKEIPVVDTTSELYYLVNRYRNDVPFLSAIIRKAEVAFEGEQLKIRSKVLENARLERQYGNPYPYYAALDAFGEVLAVRMVDEFYESRRTIYTDVFEVLDHSSFPYSRNQSNCLDRFKDAIYESTGYPFDEADEEIEARVKELIRLLENGDHISDDTPFRVVIRSMIPYYLREIVKKLGDLAEKERVREIPRITPQSETLNLATYLKEKLEPLVDREKLFTNFEHFNQGMLEVYTYLIGILRSPNLDLSYVHEVAIQRIEREVRNFKRDMRFRRYYSINEACNEFMKEFEENHPAQEWDWDENEKYVFALHSLRNKAIRDVGYGLHCLQQAATDQLDTFPSFGFGVANVVENITERFLGLYPMR